MILDRSILLVRSNNSSLSVSSIVSTISSNSRLSCTIWLLHFSQTFQCFLKFVTPVKIFCTRHPPPLAVCAQAQAGSQQEGTRQEKARRADNRNIATQRNVLNEHTLLNN